MSRGWWLAANVATAQLLLHFVSARHEGFDGGPPRFGFPLPMQWAGPNSLEVVLCPLGWLVDLLAYCVALSPLFVVLALLLRGHGRVAAVVTSGLALFVTAVLLLLPIQYTFIEWKVPKEPTTRSFALGPFTGTRS
jgi:hypothetical protein